MSEEHERQAMRPVIALMGEFSAGKSTLSNLLLGAGRSPVKVTATQLPPIWFSHGTSAPYRVGLDGQEIPITLGELDTVSVMDTAHIRVFCEADILDLMDLIDMPGNSDPNMSAEVWQRALHHATGVIWCTHANQAWRQSEAAVWDEIPDALRENSLLLLTRFDKIIGETDRARVLRRVRAETDGMFRGVFPISLTEALSAGEDREKWEASGAEAFLQELLEIVLAFGASSEPEPEPEPLEPVMPRRVAAAGGERPRTRPRG